MKTNILNSFFFDALFIGSLAGLGFSAPVSALATPSSTTTIQLTMDAPIQNGEFRDLVTQALQSCQNLRCENAPIQMRSLSASEKQALSPAQLENLRSIAQDYAENEWPETVLDGPYVASFHPSLSRIEGLFANNQLIGYRITAIDRAWKTENCQYNPQQQESLKACTTGYLKETIYVDVTLSHSFHDPESNVQFFSQNR